MFKWYESAAICYAYLCDVSVDIESNIAGCRWITRGWTLQELIAPREVVFYSCNWQSLGTRSNLSARLAIATGIHEPFLVGRNLNEASVAQRMSWAAKRSTSREEDEAYCLLGIFNINIPLIYGEGLKAFIRLQEILVREYPKDHSLFAWGKVVERLSNEVDEYQAWGLKPLNIQHNPDETEMELFGLLAKRPRDFQHSGQLVCAPGLQYYFRPNTNTVSVMASHNGHVSLPRASRVIAVKHLKCPPLFLLLNMNFILLLCGQWNDLHTNFHYVAVPVLYRWSYSRLEEIVISDLFTHHKFTTLQLVKLTHSYAIEPTFLLSPRNGSVVVRRLVAEFRPYFMSDLNAEGFYGRGSIEVPGSLDGVLATIIFYNLSVKGHGLTIVVIRLGALDHSHEDSTQGRNCGRWTFRLNPFVLPGQDTREFSIINEKGNSRAAVAKEKSKLMFFPGITEAGQYTCRNWEDIAYGHDMALPRDEWRFSVIGLADVYISVERMFLDGYDSDDDSGDGGSHPFVDVLDLVVKENLDKDNIVEENWEDDGDEEPKREGADTDNMAKEDWDDRGGDEEPPMEKRRTRRE
ncbi:hypothetical protein F4823DRAFT_263721 [Ustulina deusta]|nr:hypothetical protein F4823DRAFT_263721 [Ustulina deusta]